MRISRQGDSEMERCMVRYSITESRQGPKLVVYEWATEEIVDAQVRLNGKASLVDRR